MSLGLFLLGQGFYELAAMHYTARTLEEHEDRASAVALHEEVLRVATEERHDGVRAEALTALAQHAVEDGRISDAASMVAESLRFQRSQLDDGNVAEVLCYFSHVAAAAGEFSLAACLLACFERLSDSVGRRGRDLQKIADQARNLIRSQVGDSGLEQAWRSTSRISVEDVVDPLRRSV